MHVPGVDMAGLRAPVRQLVSERQYGSWSRSIGLPEDADAKKITAKYDNGALRVLIPQLAEVKKATRKIKVTKA